MYEGKNIHFSGADNKLLCSFSSKLCNQRRLNGYGFCIRHILEDPTAPFKRCAYVAKSSNQMCTQAIPKNEDRRYCNNHMQVLGMLPKKVRKKKEKLVTVPVSENRIQLSTLGNMKPKFSLSSCKESAPSVLQTAVCVGDPDDPYAFPDTAPADIKPGSLSGAIATPTDSVLGKSLQSGTGFVRSASDISSSSAFGMSGGSMIAKYYPELAEKLEKMRAKPEPKASGKNRTKSSRTMNKLQNKIAQNKINEKLRKSQELSQTDSNSSPVHMSSPETGHAVDHISSPSSVFSSAGSSHNYSPQASHHQALNSARGTYDHDKSSQEIPTLPQVDTSILATLATQDSLGFQNSKGSEKTVASSRLLSPHTPPRLPPPYPGSSTLTPASLTSDLPARAFSPQTNINSVIESLSTGQSPQQALITQTGSPAHGAASSVSLAQSLPFTPPHPSQQSKFSTSSFLSPSSSSPVTPKTPTSYQPFVPPLAQGGVDQTDVKTLPTSLSSGPSDIFSLYNQKQIGLDLNQSGVQSQLLPSPNTLVVQMSLPPPPPYVPPVIPPKHMTAIPNVSLSGTAGLSKQSKVHTLSSLAQCKLRKLKGILTEKQAQRKLKSDLAVKFYSFYAKRKIANHCMVGPFLCSSDESEDEDVDMLPWQPDVFSASSDEEGDGDEFGNDVPLGMRPTKLSLLKTRFRRQWSQARKAFRMNRSMRQTSNQSTLALIRTIRDGGACAVRAMWQIRHVKRSKKRLKKQKKKERLCCQKSEADGKCTNPCLPYTNHCLRHIMYNIDQQLFDYCTAKFADNTQCCMPVFDIRHELPLCPVHAAKADNYQKQLEAENKKKPRKKSKPPALTRPPRKGKKKKKGRHARPQKPMPPVDSVAMDSTLSDVDVLGLDSSKNEDDMPTPSSSGETVSTPLPSTSSFTTTTTTTSPVTSSKTTVSAASSLSMNTTANMNKSLDPALEMGEALSPGEADFDKPFEIPARLLEESDFQEVVNKLPFDALDLFGKNGDPEQEETDQVALELGSVSKTRDAIEKLLCGTMSEEESMQIAMLLAQNLHTDAELAHSAGLIAETLPAGNQSDGRMLPMGNSMMDMTQMPSQDQMCVLDMPGQLLGHPQTTMASDSITGADGRMVMLPSGQSQQALSQPQGHHQGMPLMQSVGVFKHRFDNSKGPSKTHQPHMPDQNIPTCTASTSSYPMQRDNSSSLTADLNTVYGQIESLTQSQLAADRTTGLSLTNIAPQLGLDSFNSSSKAVARHVSNDSRPNQDTTGAMQYGYGNVLPPPSFPSNENGHGNVQYSQMNSDFLNKKMQGMTKPSYPVNTDNNPARPSQPGVLPMGSQNTQTAAVHPLSVSSGSPALSLQSSHSPLLPSASSSLQQSAPLSLPSLAKKAKLGNKPVIHHQQQQQQSNLQLQQQQMPKQQRPLILKQQQHQMSSSPTVRNMLKSSSPNSRLTLPDSNDRSQGQALSASPNQPHFEKSKSSSMPTSLEGRLSLSGMQQIRRSGGNTPKFPSGPKSQPLLSQSGNAKLKLPSSNAIIAEIAGNNRLTLVDNGNTSQLSSPSLPSSTSSCAPSLHLSSPQYGVTSSKLQNVVHYAMTTSSSFSSAPTSLQKTLFADTFNSNQLSNSISTESISVTVRHPSTLESVPTTVRHNLPDSFPSQVPLPTSPLTSSPLLSRSSIPSSSSSSTPPPSSTPQLVTVGETPSLKTQHPNIATTQSSTSELHSMLSSQLSSQRMQWGPSTQSLSLPNGLPFVVSNARNDVVKLNPAGQGASRAKQTATDTRHSPLTNSIGLPVVCSPVTLPGFAQPLPTTTFKSSGSS